MLRRVLERCRRADHVETVVLCTDSEQIRTACAGWGFPVLMTPTACASGSERLAGVIDQLIVLAKGSPQDTVIINVQGDQPFIDPAVIDQMAFEFERRHPTPEVLTPVYRLGVENVHNSNVVKTLLAADGRALYFSRSALPHVRGEHPDDWHRHAPYWGHVGIYGYRADVLARWGHLPHSPLEHTEKLEQLRLIEAGIVIGTFPVEGESLSVDTPEQLDLARTMARDRG